MTEIARTETTHVTREGLTRGDGRYRTNDGDMLDAIAHAHNVSLSSLLEANPGIAEHGPLLPAGLNLQIPAVRPQPSPTIRLWG